MLFMCLWPHCNDYLVILHLLYAFVARNNVATVKWLLNISIIQSPLFCYLVHYIKPVKHRTSVVKHNLLAEDKTVKQSGVTCMYLHQVWNWVRSCFVWVIQVWPALQIILPTIMLNPALVWYSLRHAAF